MSMSRVQLDRVLAAFQDFTAKGKRVAPPVKGGSTNGQQVPPEKPTASQPAK